MSFLPPVEAFYVGPWDDYEVFGPHIPDGWALRTNMTRFWLVLAPGIQTPSSIATVDCVARKLVVLDAKCLHFKKGALP